jgi:uncharacterized repeat protein (TIGR01451 family)
VPGRYFVSVQVSDVSLLSDSRSGWLVVYAPLSVDFRAPTSVTVGDPVQFWSTSFTDAARGLSVTDWSWDFGDGTPAGAGELPVHTFAAAGPHDVVLTVTDSAGRTGSVTHTIDVQGTDVPADPVAAFAVTTPAPTAGAPVSFDAGGSSDSDGSIVGYAWNFGDDATATGATPSHTYARPGDYDVVLTVTDDDGHTNSLTKRVTVADAPPVAAFTFSPSSPVAGDAVSFDSGGSSDVDGTVESYAWNFGDGATATGKTPSHAFARPDDYDVVLTVTDDAGRSHSVTHRVSVAPAAPSAAFSFSPTNPLVGRPVAFDAGGSAASTGTITGYSWTFGDGSTATGVRPSHTYAGPGTYAVQLTVTDSAGSTGTVKRNVSVRYGAADLSVAVSGSAPRSGQYTYTVTVRNLGPTAAYGVVLTNTIDPRQTLLVQAVAPAGLDCSGLPVGATGALTCRAAPGSSLRSGYTWVVRFTVRQPSPAVARSVSEVSRVSALNSDPVTLNNVVTRTTSVPKK